MKKQDYIAKRDFLHDEMVRIKNEMRDLQSEYMNANLPLKIGQKVKITIPSHTVIFSGGEKAVPEKVEFGFIRSYSIDYNDNAVYKYSQIKKNGDESSRELYLSLKNAIVEAV